MEKGFATENDLKKPAVWKRAFPVLVAAVVVLAVTFIAFIVSGSWYIQQMKSSCVETPSSEQKEEFDITMNDESQVTEHIVVFKDIGIEFITVKEGKTGYISHIATLDHRRDIITIYSSALNKCVLAKDEFPGIEDDLEYFRTHNGKTFDTPDETRSYVIGSRVTAIDDVPLQMMPYCTLRNTYMLHNAGEGERVKRADRLCVGISIGRLCIGVSWDSHRAPVGHAKK